MAKFCFASDLHLEFGALTINNSENADCLILAGDVVEFSNLMPKSDLSYNRYDEFFAHISREFKQVIWVPGNHEYYGSSLHKGPDIARNYLERMGFGNIKLVNNDVVDVCGVPVICSTMWTSFKNADPLVMRNAQDGMNDYVHIQTRRGEVDVVLRAQDVLEEHRRALETISRLVDSKPCVVVTHHAPTLQCSDREHSHPTLDYAYMSDLSEFILDRPSIKYWIYGHTHSRKSMQIGETVVMSNCRGYARYEKMSATFEPKFFTVEGEVENG